MTNSNDARFGTALIVGGSIGGSAAAAALSPHFDNVLVLDKDELPDEPRTRKGVPHGHQFHVLTVGARDALEELFPGLVDDLRAAGVPWTDPALGTRYASKAGWFVRQKSDMRMLQPTRRYLECYVRDRTRKIENVTVHPRVQVNGLLIEDGVVKGVLVEDINSGETRELRADLVVDSSGRASRAPEWLSEAGYQQPDETTVNARWGYATTYVTVPEDWDPGYRSLYVSPTGSGDGPEATRGAAMWIQEDNQVVLTAQGCAGDYPPGDLEGFRDYLSTVDSPEFLELLDQYGPSAPVQAWRNTTNRMRNFADLPARPENFVVIGDAVAAFNPVHGQGMVLAATGALLLGKMVSEQRARATVTGFAANFQKQLAEPLAAAWQFSTTSDLNVRGVEVDGIEQKTGKTPESEYSDRVIALATEDPAIALKYMETVNFVRGIEWLGDEDLRQRVLADWDRLGSKTRGTENAGAEPVGVGSAEK